jgi:hypothetical protein
MCLCILRTHICILRKYLVREVVRNVVAQRSNQICSFVEPPSRAVLIFVVFLSGPSSISIRCCVIMSHSRARKRVRFDSALRCKCADASCCVRFTYVHTHSLPSSQSFVNFRVDSTIRLAFTVRFPVLNRGVSRGCVGALS